MKDKMKRNKYRIFYSVIFVITLYVSLKSVKWCLFQAIYSDAKSSSNTEELEEFNIQTLERLEVNLTHITFNVTIHMAFAVTGPEYIHQSLVLVKSVLLFTDSQTVFHIFLRNTSLVSEYNKFKITQTVAKNTSFTFLFYQLQWDSLLHYISDRTRFGRISSFCDKTQMLLRLIYEMPQLTEVLVLDVDMIFLTDAIQIWKHIEQFSDTNIAGMCPGGERFHKADILYPFVQPYGVNGGLYLLNLTRTRKADFANEIIDIAWNRSYKINIHAEQALSNIYFSQHDAQLYRLGCEWNFGLGIDPCRLKGTLFCKQAYQSGIQILHGTAHSFVFREKSYVMLHSAFDLYDPTIDKAWPYWNKVVSQFVSLRNTFCNDNGFGLLQSLLKSVLTLTSGQHYLNFRVNNSHDNLNNI